MRADRHARHRRPDSDRRRRPVDGFRTRDRHRFERLVEDAVAALPPGLLDHLDGVVLMVAEIPPDVAGPDGGGPPGEVPLGHYHPAPRRRRTAAPLTADRLVLYRRPLEGRATSKRDLLDLIQDVVVTELADHHGLDDDALDDLGWD